MALTKTQENDKIEIVNKWNIQIRNVIIIEEDGKQISRTYHRYVLVPGTLKGGDGADKDDLVNTDLSGEDDDVKRIAEAAWTSQVKTDYTAFLVANKPTSE